MVPISDLAERLKSNAAVKSKWQEATTNIADKALRKYMAADVSDGHEFNVAHVQHATVLNDAQYLHCFGEKSKVKTCKTLKTCEAPSLTRPGENELVNTCSYHGTSIAYSIPRISVNLEHLHYMH